MPFLLQESARAGSPTALGDRDPLVKGADGALTLHLQADSPGADKEANWLPVGWAPFAPLLRLYAPRSEVRAGVWTPPLAVKG